MDVSGFKASLTNRAYAGLVAWDAGMRKAGLRYAITRTTSKLEHQLCLYMQGRGPKQGKWETPTTINTLRSIYKLRPISLVECDTIVTWKILSDHLVGKGFGAYSRAWDYVLLDGSGRRHYNLKENANQNQIADYNEACQIAEDLGLETGRSYGDYCHIAVGEI